MLANFSERTKFLTWRKLWIALAEAEHELGLPITAEQVAELRAHEHDLDLELARLGMRERACPNKRRTKSSAPLRRTQARKHQECASRPKRQSRRKGQPIRREDACDHSQGNPN